mmetsp:Transcript_45929/g.70293  ORF Transcript_45929/g.70293 Transcript_45929/m.70293 type:complete len:731 (+) Transcript_45929:1-2193(+)
MANSLLDKPISHYFGCNTFNDKAQREYLPRAVYKDLKGILNAGRRLPLDTANAVAHTMKQWAMEKGATHYAHWFLPWTGASAEKHDAFIDWDGNGAVMERFTGACLVQGEPDASSFPSGGLRPTFEARGYTAWDPSSPAFIFDGKLGKTLCIPCAFIGYHGEALDQKTPLLRSLTYVAQHAAKALEFFEIEEARVQSQCGPEQEYFLIDAEMYKQREDLLICNRSLQGARHVKGQVMEDHYFGSIKPRVLDFMHEVEAQSYKLGIAAKTRHNEVAPNQFEVAPIYEEANLAADHNLMMMEIMRKTAEKMGLVCLMHEKPFAGINGSGKHVNWSLSAETRSETINLLDPGEHPGKSPIFLYFLCACLKGLQKHAGLMRASVAGAGNDHRLGANEAPPAIMSAFLGAQLTHILDKIDQKGVPAELTSAGGLATVGSMAEALQLIDMSESRLPVLNKDPTDRNRTSPFAFTGNKFEFRAVGSSQAIHQPLFVINATVGQALREMNEHVSAKVEAGSDTTLAVFEEIVDVIRATKHIRFEGDNYSDEWKAEAARRGLPILPSTAEALDVWTSAEAKTLLTESKIFNESELDARVAAKRENYCKTLILEASVLLDMAETQINPSVLKELGAQATAVNALKAAGVTGIDKVHQLQATADHLATATAAAEEMRQVLATAHGLEDGSVEATRFCGSKLFATSAALRDALDAVESKIDRATWPVPSYKDLLRPLFPRDE